MVELPTLLIPIVPGLVLSWKILCEGEKKISLRKEVNSCSAKTKICCRFRSLESYESHMNSRTRTCNKEGERKREREREPNEILALTLTLIRCFETPPPPIKPEENFRGGGGQQHNHLDLRRRIVHVSSVMESDNLSLWRRNPVFLQCFDVLFFAYRVRFRLWGLSLLKLL
jgi:hypothetical protein